MDIFLENKTGFGVKAARNTVEGKDIVAEDYEYV